MNGKAALVIFSLFMLALLAFGNKHDVDIPQHVGVATERVHSISITPPTGGTLSLEKTGETWQITSPVQTNADQEEVALLLQTIASMEFTNMVTDTPALFGNYGVDPIQGTQVRYEAPGVLEELVIGNVSTQTYQTTYVRKGSYVYEVDGALTSIFTPTLYALRSKALVAEHADDVEQIVILEQDTGNKFTLSKVNKQWISEPKLPLSRIDDILINLLPLEVIGIEDQPEGDLAPTNMEADHAHKIFIKIDDANGILLYTKQIGDTWYIHRREENHTDRPSQKLIQSLDRLFL